jgi:hypothetical protein
MSNVLFPGSRHESRITLRCCKETNFDPIRVVDPHLLGWVERPSGSKILIFGVKNLVHQHFASIFYWTKTSIRVFLHMRKRARVGMSWQSGRVRGGEDGFRDLHVSRFHFPRTLPDIAQTDGAVESVENRCKWKKCRNMSTECRAQ